MEANYFTIFYWFCHISTWIHHGCTRVPHPEPPPTSLPIPSLWVIPVHQPQASCIMHRTWTGDSFLTWYYTCFNAILPNHPTLSLSHRVQKTVLYICVSVAVSHTKLWYIYTMEYYSAIKKNTFESVLMRWMKLEPTIQSEVSQKEKHQYSMLLLLLSRFSHVRLCATP